MAYLFDTDAISEVFKRRPASGYLRWLVGIPRADQFTSAVVIGELYRGAFLAENPSRHLENIDGRVLSAVTVLPYDVSVARVFGEIQAGLAHQGRLVADADLQIAATAIRHDLEVVTGNLRHFEPVPGLRVSRALADARLGRA